jgi:hypothetical protein
VKELVIVVVKVADILEFRIPQSLESGDAVSDREVLVKGLRSPVIGRIRFDDRLETVPLITIRNLHSGPVEEGGGQVEIEGDRFGDLALFFIGDAGIMDDEGNAERFLVV